jgi:hypothetical protein
MDGGRTGGGGPVGGGASSRVGEEQGERLPGGARTATQQAQGTRAARVGFLETR